MMAEQEFDAVSVEVDSPWRAGPSPSPQSSSLQSSSPRPPGYLLSASSSTEQSYPPYLPSSLPPPSSPPPLLPAGSPVASCQGSWSPPFTPKSCKLSEESSFPPQLVIDSVDVLLGERIRDTMYDTLYYGWYKKDPVMVMTPRLSSGPTDLSDMEMQDGYTNQIRLLSKLTHPNIVEFKGATLLPPSICLMEPMHGTLETYVKNATGPPNLKEMLGFALDVSRGMLYLHRRGYIHYDLVPGNIFITLDLKGAKVCGFGRARDESVEPICYTAPVYCTIAPEMYLECPVFEQKVDVYSFAFVLFFMLTKISFEGNLLGYQLMPYFKGIPEDITLLIYKCLSVRPSIRPDFWLIVMFLAERLHRMDLFTKRHIHTIIGHRELMYPNII